MRPPSRKAAVWKQTLHFSAARMLSGTTEKNFKHLGLPKSASRKVFKELSEQFQKVKNGKMCCQLLLIIK